MSTRQILLAFQVALAVTLGVTAALFGRSFIKIAAVEAGFDHPESVLIARLVSRGQTPERLNTFYDELFTKLATTPTVVSAGAGWNPPFMSGYGPVAVPGPDGITAKGALSAASPGLFSTLGIPFVAGRDFNWHDQDGTDAVIVNEILAKQFWPKGEAIGQPLLFSSEQRPRHVIGVTAERLCEDLLAAPGPCIWIPFPKNSSASYIRIRTTIPPEQFIPQLREIARTINPDVAVAEEIPLDVFLGELTGRPRAAAIASAALAFMGVALLAVGCASLFVSMVAGSVREIAIRIALGVTRFRLGWRIVAQGLGVALAGGIVGIVGAAFIARGLTDELYETNVLDQLTFGAVVSLVFGVVVSAALYASRLAGRVEPCAHLKRD